MGLLINLFLLICTGLLSVDSRGLLAPNKKAAAQVKNTTAKVTKASADDDDEPDVMAPPMEPFEEVDSDVDEDADKKEMQVEEEELKGHNPGKMFGVHEVGQKDNVNKQQRVDPMEAVHKNRLGENQPKVRKAAISSGKVRRSQAPEKGSHLDKLKDLVGEVDEEAPKPVAKPEQKKPNATAPENITIAVSAETAAQVEKMKEWREKEKAAATTTTTTAAPKKPHNLGKDLAKIGDMAPLDDEVVAKLKEAMPSAKKPTASVPAAVHGHEHGDAIGRLHADAVKHKLEVEAANVVHTTTTAAPAARRATPEQLAAARRASALTDALRNVNASEVALNLDVSEEAAKKIRNIEAKVKAETDHINAAPKPKPVAQDHMEELRATAEKVLDEKVQQLAAKKAKKAAAKQEPASKLAAALGINDEEAEAMMTTTATPSKAVGAAAVDPIKALHQRIEQSEPKKQVEKPKAAPKPVQQKVEDEEPESGIISGFHHNKARDHLAPVLR